MLLVDVVAGLLVDLGFLPFRDKNSLPAYALAGGLASASNVFVFQLFASVPAVTFPHSTPQHHYMGFTPVGLGCLCYAAGFDILHIGQWGNAHYIKLMFEMRAWPDYVLLGDQIQNDFNNPAGTWILAQRPV